MSVSISVTTTTAAELDIDVMRTGSKAQLTLTRARNNATQVAVVAATGTQDDTGALLIKLTETAGSSGANATADMLSVEFLQAA